VKRYCYLCSEFSGECNRSIAASTSSTGKDFLAGQQSTTACNEASLASLCDKPQIRHRQQVNILLKRNRNEQKLTCRTVTSFVGSSDQDSSRSSNSDKQRWPWLSSSFWYNFFSWTSSWLSSHSTAFWNMCFDSLQFYRVLETSGYAKQAFSLYLTSHGVLQIVADF